MLGLTNPVTAWAWKYSGGPISKLTQSIGATARSVGYNAIKFPSLRGPGTNFAILDDFNDILKPQMVSPLA